MGTEQIGTGEAVRLSQQFCELVTDLLAVFDGRSPGSVGNVQHAIVILNDPELVKNVSGTVFVVENAQIATFC